MQKISTIKSTNGIITYSSARVFPIILILLLTSCLEVAVAGGTYHQRQGGPAKRPAITKALPMRADSVSALEQVVLGGVKQTILIRGQNRHYPILLLLHGGPGFSEMPFFRTHNRELEDHFVVINWDQRGSGLSFSLTSPASMTIRQFVSDAHELVTLLKKRFDQDKIFLLGNSWGSLLGVRLVQEYPQDFLAYVGVAQMVDIPTNERLSFHFTLQQAKKAQNIKAIQELTAIQSHYSEPSQPTLHEFKIQRRWLEHFGGVMHTYPNYDKLFASVTAQEKNLYNKKLTVEGELFSLTYLLDEIMTINFTKSALFLTVPVYFMVGRHDFNVVSTLTEPYYQQLKAPRKALIWFERSGHFPSFEEPAKFNDLMINTVLRENSPKK